jgi:hypothetical protein
LNDIGNDSGVGFEAAERCLHRSEVGCEGSGADVGVDKELVESVVGRVSEGGEALFGVSCEGSEVALECELLAEEAVHVGWERRIAGAGEEVGSGGGGGCAGRDANCGVLVGEAGDLALR